MKRAIAVFLISGAALLIFTIAQPAQAQTFNTQLNINLLNLLPPPTTTDPPWNFHHVQPADFDPGKTYLVQATWISGIGCSINATIAIPNMSFTGIGSFGRGMPETRLRFDTVCTVFPRENRWLLDML